MSELPKVAGIVVNWNSGELLNRCMQALSEQTTEFAKIIVVDNGSTDESASDLQERFEGVILVRLETNVGFAEANNIAVGGLNAFDWIALVNPDAFPEPDWLARLLAAARAYPEYAFFGSRMLTGVDSTELDGTGDVYHASGLAWRRGHGRAARDRDLKPEEIFAPCAAAALYRRDALVKIGGFDEDYFAYFEDIDLAFRLRLAGYKCLYAPGAVVHHVGSAITGKKSDFTVYHGHRNLVWTYFKNMPWPLFWLYLPQHILLNVVSIIYFSLRGQARVVFKAKWDAFKGLPRILRERRRVQVARKVDVWQLRRLMARGWLTPYLRALRQKA